MSVRVLVFWYRYVFWYFGILLSVFWYFGIGTCFGILVSGHYQVVAAVLSGDNLANFNLHLAFCEK